MSGNRRLIVHLGGTAVWLILAIRGSAQIGDELRPESAKTPMAQLVSELIRAELPPYEPPSAEIEELDPAAVAGEIKEGTLHLPTMTVRQQMKAPLHSTDWLTAQGRMELALRRYPGTRIGNFFGANNPWAWERLTESVEAERHDALKERSRRVLLGSEADVQEDQKLLRAALAYSGRPPP
jgi:hypothetical protein